MATIVGQPRVQLKVTLELDEEEAQALNALTLYGSKEFLDVFYERLGKTYLQPYERGLISLFNSVRHSMPDPLTRAEEARKSFQAPSIK